MKQLVGAWLTLMVLAATPIQAGHTLNLEIQPQKLEYPAKIPRQGYSFSEVLYVSYPPSLANSTVVVQYLDPSGWHSIASFKANSVGFTVFYLPVTAYWARPGENTLRVVAGNYTSNTVVLVVEENGGGFLFQGAIYAVLVAAPTLLILFAPRSRRLVLGVFALYFSLSPFTGQRYDMYFLMTSGIRILEHVNPFNPGNPPAYPFPLKWAYPPLYPLYSALAFEAYSLLTHTPVPAVGSTVYPGYYTAPYSVWMGYVPEWMPVLAFLLKLPMLLSFVAAYRVFSKRLGEPEAAKFWAFNPLVFLVCSVWGQLDPIAVTLTLLSLDSYLEGKTAKAYLYSALGGAVKLWPAALLPIYLAQRLALEGRGAIKPFAVVVAPLAAATIGVYAAFGDLAQTLWILVYARGVPTYAGEFSVNGLTWQWILYLAKSPPIPVFLAAGPVAYAAVLAYAYRHPRADPVGLTVLVLLTIYLTYNYVNPQYFLWIIPLLILQGRRVSAWAFTALPLLFVALSYNVFYFVSPTILYDVYSNSASIAEELKIAFFYNYKPLFIAVASFTPLAAYVLELRAQIKLVRLAARSLPSAVSSKS